jgi:hypothetical protein
VIAIEQKLITHPYKMEILRTLLVNGGGRSVIEPPTCELTAADCLDLGQSVEELPGIV